MLLHGLGLQFGGKPRIYWGNWILRDELERCFGGGGEIRTHGRVPPSLVFKTSALNHSATPPVTQTALYLTLAKKHLLQIIQETFAEFRRLDELVIAV